MLPYLAALALTSFALTGIFTWGVARRYGRGHALVVPVIALGAILFVIGRIGMSGSGDGQILTALAVTMAGSAVVGALAGLQLSRRGRK